jgi:septum formation protein
LHCQPTCTQLCTRILHRVFPMLTPLILASSSPTRSALLRQAGLDHRTAPPRVDEDAAKAALIAEGATPRDIADTLAELKARKIAEKEPTSLVLGCDQTLSLSGQLFSKPESPDHATRQITTLQGQTHTLHSALVLYESARPVWRHIAESRLTMRPLSSAFITAYVARNWPDISYSVGGYLIESTGITLFSDIRGEHSAILGLPIPPFISYLATRGLIAT